MEIKLSRFEALVLEDVLSKLEDSESFQELDLAGRIVLYKIHAILEQELDELFDSHYQELLKSAQAEDVSKGAGS